MRRLKSAPDTYGGIFDVDGKTVEIAKFDEKMAAEGFWNDQKAAQEVIAEANKLKRVVNSLTEFRAKLEDAQGMENVSFPHQQHGWTVTGNVEPHQHPWVVEFRPADMAGAYDLEVTVHES